MIPYRKRKTTRVWGFDPWNWNVEEGDLLVDERSGVLYIPLPIETCIGGTICAGYASLRAWAQDAQKELVSLRARVAELEEGISTAMQLIEGGFDSAAYEALEALNAHK